ncbi:MAG: TIR domain-containing protein [Hyphomicrobiales bacterium]
MKNLKLSAEHYKTEDPYLGFFAYSRADEERLGGRLKEIHAFLEKELTNNLGVSGGRIYLDVNMGPGSEYRRASAEVLENCYFIVVCVSDIAINDSNFCAWECQKFLDREKVLGAQLAYPVIVGHVSEFDSDALNAVEKIYNDRNWIDIRDELKTTDDAQLAGKLKELAGKIENDARPAVLRSIRGAKQKPSPFAAVYERATAAPVKAGLVLTFMLLVCFVIWQAQAPSGIPGLELGYALLPAIFSAYATTPLGAWLFVSPANTRAAHALVALSVVALSLLFSLLLLSSVVLAAVMAAVTDVVGLWVLLSMHRPSLNALPLSATFGPAFFCCLIAALIPLGGLVAMHPAPGAGMAALGAIWLLIRNLYVLEFVGRLKTE